MRPRDQLYGESYGAPGRNQGNGGCGKVLCHKPCILRIFMGIRTNKKKETGVKEIVLGDKILIEAVV